MRGGHVDLIPLEESGNEGIWSMHQLKPAKGVSEVSMLFRVVFTSTRVHALAYLRRNRELTSTEREEWISKFKQAKLVTAVQPGTNAGK